jgi:uncharacterized membrane protein
MLTVPTETPVNVPAGAIDTIPAGAKLHAPPAGVVVSVVALPTHVTSEPVNAAGVSLTVTVVTKLQPVTGIV